jgi:signal transduction histidine kinase
VLLVEDNLAEAVLVAERLSESHSDEFDIVHVTTLEAAIAACRASRFDCIVMDLQLPDSMGADTVRAMRAQGCAVAIVAFSGLDDERARAGALAEGAQAFISKNGSEAGALDRGILFALEHWRALKLHRQLEDLLAVNPDAVVVLGEDNVVRFANPAACRLFEHDEGEFVGAQLALDVREGVAGDIVIATDGGQRLGKIRAESFLWEDAPALLLNIRDVTEHRAMAERLREAQKMEAIGKFAGGVAHDLGNVLSCVDVLVRAARTQAGQAAQTGMLNEIVHAVESGRGLIRQLIALERSGESGEAERCFAPEKALAEMEIFLRRTLPAQIEISLEIQSGLAPIAMDRGLFEQVLLNLVLNARDAMPEGGHLRIACAGGEANTIVLRVSDDGVGIAPEHLGRVFDLFFTTKAKGRGSGLGLGMCRTIVERAGGTISVQSAPGEGAAFTIVLPSAAVQAPSLSLSDPICNQCG